MLIGVSLLLFLVLYALFAVYAERKIAAFMQDRLGPMQTGAYGWLQSFADILKLLQKENIRPALADKYLFPLAPIVIFVAVFMGLVIIPIAPGLAGSQLNLGLFYVIAITSVEVLGVFMAGWASHNKYALYGALRSVAQIIAYEIPAGIALLSGAVIFQSLNLQEIVLSQGVLSKQPIFFLGIFEVGHLGGFFCWTIFQAPHMLMALCIYFVCSLAQSNRAPFDLAEAESELVAGFHVEYTGIKFAMIFLAEYGMMLLLSLLSATLFLGGWNSPLPNIGLLELAFWTTGTFWGIFWLLLKAFFLIAIQMALRWTLPRFRIDQLTSLCWKVLTPWAFVCFFISALWRLLVMQ